MKIEELLQRKNKIQGELDRLGTEIREAKAIVLKEIKVYIKEFDISCVEIKGIYDELNPSAALAPKKARKVPADRKGFKYHNAKIRKWYNGYTPIPKWFDLTKADQYLVAGQTHSSVVIKALNKQNAAARSE